MSDPGWVLLRATEAAALAAFRHLGRGNKLAADRDASQALRDQLSGAGFRARVVIGEGEKDGAPGLFAGEVVGAAASLTAPVYDLAVDPIDGTTQTAQGGHEALSALAAGRENSLFSTRVFYMKKIAVGPRIARRLGGLKPEWLHAPAGPFLERVAAALDTEPARLTVCVLDRPRHEGLIQELRQAGCRLALPDCDVSGTVAVAVPGAGIDLCLGIGGAPEAVLSAAALKCLGGEFVAMLMDREGSPVDGRVLTGEDLAQGEVLFAATGITNGRLLGGVRLTDQGFRTHSVVMSSAQGTIRWVKTHYPTGGPSLG